MPAEWEPHEATWLSWPYNLGTWEGHLEGAERAFLQMIEALTQGERVELLVPDAKTEARVKELLNGTRTQKENLAFHMVESGDVWIRDYGPIFVKNAQGEVGYTKWLYNAYGKPKEYHDLMIGNEVPDQLPLNRYRRFASGIVLEGGSIDVNGKGSLLTTESCLLSPTRNPTLTKEQIELCLHDFLGATNILWLGEGIAGDDTTGHVDDLTRFVGQSTVVTVIEEDPTDENYKPLQENKKRLETMKDERGTPLTVLTLPMPPRMIVEGRRMAACYANFYIANGVVLVPTYHPSTDAVALDVLQKCFPNRKIIGIDSRELIWGYGSIHCASQQQPK